LCWSSGVERQCRRRDFDRGGLLLQCKLDVQRVDGACGNVDLVYRVGWETRSRDRDFVKAERDILERKDPVVRRRGGVIDTRC